MSLFNFFNKKDTKQLEKQGGMKVKYQKLINLIEYLSKEDYIPRTSVTFDFVKLEHPIKSSKKSINHYAIEIFFKREGQIFVSLDIFELIDKSNEKLFIKYSRDTTNISPDLPRILPEKIREKWSFNARTDQKEIFLDLIKNIVNMYSNKYNFSDLYFESILEI